MSVEEPSRRMDSWAARKERERELRRLRDRQRRESMSSEQKQQHLAKRRRNYQLRRQRAGQGQSKVEQSTGNEHKRTDPASEAKAHCDATKFDNGHSKQNAVCTKVEGLDSDSREAVQFPRRLRFNHIKQLARSLHDPVSKLNGRSLIGSDVISREVATTNCKLPGKLRLSRIKCLARALNSTRETGQQHHSMAEGP